MMGLPCGEEIMIVGRTMSTQSTSVTDRQTDGRTDRQRFLPRSMEKNPVNFGPQTKKCYWLELSHPSRFFGGDYISAVKGCCPLKFSYALEIDQVLLGHTKMWIRVPPKKKVLIVKI